MTDQNTSGASSGPGKRVNGHKHADGLDYARYARTAKYAPGALKCTESAR